MGQLYTLGLNSAKGVARVAPLIDDGNVILLCVCPDHTTCHRTQAAEVLHQATGAPIEHLDVRRAASSQTELI